MRLRAERRARYGALPCGGCLFPQKLGKPEQLASMVLECITNSYMNAETIRVDGGIRMQPK